MITPGQGIILMVAALVAALLMLYVPMDLAISVMVVCWILKISYVLAGFGTLLVSHFFFPHFLLDADE